MIQHRERMARLRQRIVGAAVPLGHVARPEKIGGLATFLANASADCVVARCWSIDDGAWMS